MEITENIRKGQIVKSKNGRDLGTVFVISDILNQKYVEVVDGKTRLLEKPKKKNIKHLMIYKDVFEDFEKLDLKKFENNSKIRKKLKEYNN